MGMSNFTSWEDPFDRYYVESPEAFRERFRTRYSPAQQAAGRVRFGALTVASRALRVVPFSSRASAGPVVVPNARYSERSGRAVRARRPGTLLPSVEMSRVPGVRRPRTYSTGSGAGFAPIRRRLVQPTLHAFAPVTRAGASASSGGFLPVGPRSFASQVTRMGPTTAPDVRFYRRRMQKKRSRGSTSRVTGSIKVVRPRATRDFPLFSSVARVGPQRRQMRQFDPIGVPGGTTEFLFTNNQPTEVYTLNEIAQGDDIWQRETNHIRMVSLTVRGWWRAGNLIGAPPVRRSGMLALVYWNQLDFDRVTGNYLAPRVSDIFDVDTVAPTEEAIIHEKAQARSLCKILARWNFGSVSLVPTENGVNDVSGLFFVTVPINLPATYREVGPGAQRLVSGGLFFVHTGNVADTGQPAVLRLAMRLHFYDESRPSVPAPGAIMPRVFGPHQAPAAYDLWDLS